MWDDSQIWASHPRSPVPSAHKESMPSPGYQCFQTLAHYLPMNSGPFTPWEFPAIVSSFFQGLKFKILRITFSFSLPPYSVFHVFMNEWNYHLSWLPPLLKPLMDTAAWGKTHVGVRHRSEELSAGRSYFELQHFPLWRKQLMKGESWMDSHG